MSELVYTRFGYGTVAAVEPKGTQEDSNKETKASDQAKVNPESEKEATIQEKNIDDLEDKVVKVTFKWGATGYIPVNDYLIKESSLMRQINIKVKTFFGPRKTYDLTLPVTANLAAIFAEMTKVAGADIIDNLSNPKFYYSMV